MAQIEKCLDLTAGTDVADNTGDQIDAGERARLLELVGRLAAPQLGLEVRLDLIAQMRCVLHHETPKQVESTASGNGRGTAALPDLMTLASVAQSW